MIHVLHDLMMGAGVLSVVNAAKYRWVIVIYERVQRSSHETHCLPLGQAQYFAPHRHGKGYEISVPREEQLTTYNRSSSSPAHALDSLFMCLIVMLQLSKSISYQQRSRLFPFKVVFSDPCHHQVTKTAHFSWPKQCCLQNAEDVWASGTDPSQDLSSFIITQASPFFFSPNNLFQSVGVTNAWLWRPCIVNSKCQLICRVHEYNRFNTWNSWSRCVLTSR